MLVVWSKIVALKDKHRQDLWKALVAGFAVAILGTGYLLTVNSAQAGNNHQWPANADWQQETLLNKSANVVVGTNQVTMTALGPTSSVTPEVIVTGLDTPWSMRFAPDGKLFITERPGRVRVYENGQLNPTPVLTISGTETLSSEEGLQGMALDPDFSQNGYMYLYYTYTATGGGMKNRLARYVIQNNATVGSPTILVDNVPGSQFHNGGRIAFGPDGKLYVAIGSADSDAAAQDLNSNAGKILRINGDGSIPADNPFPGSPVYSLGHRNPQGLAWHPVTGKLWSTEHGPTGTPPFCCHDEVNIIEPGSNYGWPKYYGTLTNPTHSGLNVSNPIYPVFESGDSKWAPGGALFYTGDQLGAPWTNSLIFAGLGFQNAGGRSLYRLGLNADNSTPAQLESLFANQFGRIRDVTQGPAGELYMATSNRDGRGQPIPEDDRIVKLKPTFSAELANASFTLRFDAGANNTADWTALTPNSITPVGTSISLQSRSSTDGTNFSNFSDGITGTPNGRFLEVKVTLSTTRANAVPTLNNLAMTYEVLPPAPPPPPAFCDGSTALICEDFTANASRFTASGGTWAINNGKYVLSNHLTSGNGIINNRSIHSTSVGNNFVLSVKATNTPSASASNDLAVIFAYTNSTNYWVLSLAENNSTGNHGIFRIVNNGWTQVADFSGNQLVDGTTYDVRLERSGTTLKVFRNNTQISSTTQSTLPASGQVGLGSINDSASFDELLVTVPVATPPPPPAPPPPPPPPPPPSLCSGSTAAVCEDFTTSASNFTKSGGTWNVSNGKYVLTGPVQSGTGVYNRSIHNKSIAGNFTLKVKATVTPSSSASNDVAVIFGYTNASNYWFVSFAENNSTGNQGIFRVTNGAFTQVVDFTATSSRVVDGTTYDIRIERSGTALRVFRNNTQIASTTQSTIPAGPVGLGSINDAASFDELIVTQP